MTDFFRVNGDVESERDEGAELWKLGRTEWKRQEMSIDVEGVCEEDPNGEYRNLGHGVQCRRLWQRRT